MTPVLTLLTLGWALLPGPSALAENVQPFARVGEVELSRDDFERAVSQTIRSRFYHGQIPEDAEAKVRAEVAEELVDRTLLLGEAERRNIQADEEVVETTLARYDLRYADNPNWRENRDSMLTRLAEDLRNEERLSRLETEVRRVPPPTRAQLESYYLSHPDEFTEPVRMRVSLILLGVAPSASGEAWDAAFREAEQLSTQLDDGGDFAELARLHSSDDSASRGGDMGYLHSGMLGEGVQQALDDLDLGESTKPVQVLEGVVLLRLEERTEPDLREFRDVRQRVQELWLREQGDLAWALLIRQLRDSTAITIYEIPSPATRT